MDEIQRRILIKMSFRGQLCCAFIFFGNIFDHILDHYFWLFKPDQYQYEPNLYCVTTTNFSFRDWDWFVSVIYVCS